MKKSSFVAIFLTLSILAPNLSLAATIGDEEVKSLGVSVLEALPQFLLKVWKEQALPFCQKAWQLVKSFWESGIGQSVGNFLKKIFDWAGLKTPNIPEELKQEQKEATGNLWEKFKQLF
jgi:hypothetical protein